MAPITLVSDGLAAGSDPSDYRPPLSRVFLLSPANTSAIRGQLLLNRTSEFELAQRIRRQGATLGELFSFISSLYFRGKLAYAEAFSRSRYDGVARSSAARDRDHVGRPCGNVRGSNRSGRCSISGAPLQGCACAGSPATGWFSDCAARQHRERQICRSVARKFRSKSLIPSTVRGTGGYESWRPDATLR